MKNGPFLLVKMKSQHASVSKFVKGDFLSSHSKRLKPTLFKSKLLQGFTMTDTWRRLEGVTLKCCDYNNQDEDISLNKSLNNTDRICFRIGTKKKKIFNYFLMTHANCINCKYKALIFFFFFLKKSIQNSKLIFPLYNEM